MEYAWKGSALEPLAESFKYMSQDYAWFAANNQWKGVSEKDSEDCKKFQIHQEKIRPVLRNDDLLHAIAWLIIEHVWVAILDAQEQTPRASEQGDRI